MAKNNLSILVWLYKAKKNKQGTIPIYLRITYGNSRKNISTGFFIEEARWDRDKNLVRGIKPDAIEINSYLSQIKVRIMELFSEMVKQNDINLDLLLTKLLNKNNNNKTLFELIEFHNQDFKSRLGIDYAFSTLEKYDILHRKMLLFLKSKYAKTDIRLKDLSLQLISNFEFHLKSVDNNQHNTAIKYIKNLKKIMNFGILHGWIETNPFERYKATYKDVDRIYLTQTEVFAIKNTDFKSQRLNLVCDVFIFQCYTGLAYTDLKNLTISNISPGIDGNKWIITRRQKTDVRAAIPLLPIAEEILARYQNVGKLTDSSLFAFYSIQKFNSYLHEIAELCSINKNLTSHVGRRTFATTIALANGISIETISKLLGHASTKITAQYAVVTDLKISKDMLELREKLLKK